MTESCTGTVAEGQCTLVLTTAGARSLTATYAGDDTYYNPSPPSGSVVHQVDPADTTTTITSDAPDPSTVGEPVAVDFDVTDRSARGGHADRRRHRQRRRRQLHGHGRGRDLRHHA